MKLVMRIQERFYIKTWDLLILIPEEELEMDNLSNLKIGDSLWIDVLLKFPNGTEVGKQARLQHCHFNPGGYRIVWGLPEMEKDRISVGTEVWRIYLDEEKATSLESNLKKMQTEDEMESKK